VFAERVTASLVGELGEAALRLRYLLKMAGEQNPVRRFLDHETPSWIKGSPEYFLTVCCAIRGQDQLCIGSTPNRLLDSISYRQSLGQWWIELALIMPDHIHMITSFHPEMEMKRVIGDWKRFTARNLKVNWQRDFFDHRLRSPESAEQKFQYVLENPVRAGLVSQASDWPYFWTPR